MKEKSRNVRHVKDAVDFFNKYPQDKLYIPNVYQLFQAIGTGVPSRGLVYARTKGGKLVPITIHKEGENLIIENGEKYA